MEKLHRKFKNKIEFIGVNVAINESVKKAKRYVKKLNLTFPNIYDQNNSVLTSYRVAGTPAFFILDKEGVIRHKGIYAPDNIENILKRLP